MSQSEFGYLKFYVTLYAHHLIKIIPGLRPLRFERESVVYVRSLFKRCLIHLNTEAKRRLLNFFELRSNSGRRNCLKIFVLFVCVFFAFQKKSKIFIIFFSY